MRTECIYISTHYTKILEMIWLKNIYYCARNICEVFEFCYHMIHIHFKKKMFYFRFMYKAAIVVKIKCQTPILSQKNGNCNLK